MQNEVPAMIIDLQTRANDGRQTAREVHDGGVSLQRLVVVLAVKAAVTSSRKEPLFELGHGLNTTCHARS